MAIDRDGSRQGARAIGELGISGFSRRDSLSTPQQDFVDYYKFRVSSSSRVTLNLKGLQDNANLILLNSAGRLLASPRKSGRRAETITRDLDAGSYFIGVSLFGNKTTYNLETSAAPLTEPGGTPDGGGTPGGGGGSGGGTPGTDTPLPAPSSDPGSILPNAFNFALPAYRDTVGGADVSDIYRVEVDTPQLVTLGVSNVKNGSVDVKLIFDINGDGLVSSQDILTSKTVGSNPEAIARSLGKGSYFVEVSPSGGSNISYDISLKKETLPNNPISFADSDPFISLVGARDLGVLSRNTLQQLVGSTDSTDVYKFSVTDEATNFTALLNTTQRSGDVTLFLVNDGSVDGYQNLLANPGQLNNGLVVSGDFLNGVTTQGSAGGASLTMTETLGGVATYYLIVVPSTLSDNSTYTLDLFSSGFVNTSHDMGLVNRTDLSALSPNPGNTLASALNVEFGKNYKQFVGASDSLDYYKFTIAPGAKRHVSITYNGTPELAALRFGRDSNNNGFLDPGTEDANFNGLLDPGEDTNNNGRLDEEIFGQRLSGDVLYSALPPFSTGDGEFRTSPIGIRGYFTTAPTRIDAWLDPGTYYLQVDPQAVVIDNVGDPLTRYGTANILYNVSFLLNS